MTSLLLPWLLISALVILWIHRESRHSDHLYYAALREARTASPYQRTFPAGDRFRAHTLCFGMKLVLVAVYLFVCFWLDVLPPM